MIARIESLKIESSLVIKAWDLPPNGETYEQLGNHWGGDTLLCC